MPAALLMLACLLGLSAPIQAVFARDLGGSTRSLVVVNRASQPILEIHVSSTSDDSWGDDLLGDARLSPGGRTTIRIPAAETCVVDVQVVYKDGRAEERRGVNACRARDVAFDGSRAERAETPIPTRQIAILNRAARPIAQVFVSSASSDDWGEDRLGDQVIKPATRADVAFRGGCIDDVRVVFDNKAAEERRGIDLCAIDVLVVSPGWTTADDFGQLDTIVAPAAVPQVPVVNRTDATITELYVGPVDPPALASAVPTADSLAADGLVESLDRLGRGVLRAGGRTWVALNRGIHCKVAVRAVFQTTRPDLRMTADLCQSPDIAIGP